MAMAATERLASGFRRSVPRQGARDGRRVLPSSSDDRFASTQGHAAPALNSPGDNPGLGSSLFRFILNISGRHQLGLVAITIVLCLVITVPLELQRRIVNDALKRGDFRTIAFLALAYFGVALAHRGIKLALNVYRSWVGENSTRYLRSIVLAADRRATDREAGSRRGVDISIVLAEADPIGNFVGVSLSEPLLQFGVLLSLLAYMIYLQPWMAVIALASLAPQILYVPAMQNAINSRATERILTLRAVSTALNRGIRGTDSVWRQLERADHVFDLNMSIYKIKYLMNFLMNGSFHLSMAGILALGGYYVAIGKIDAGSVIACTAGLSKISDPWGDLVDWFRDLRVTQARYALIRAAELQASDAEPGTLLAPSSVAPFPAKRISRVHPTFGSNTPKFPISTDPNELAIGAPI
jgi:ABC-type bacteriocin/lantibiotic exporter with double-glycine peptidase domain